MFWMIVTRFFCKTETLRDFPCTLKAGICSLKKLSLLSLKVHLIFFLTLERSKTRQDKFESILEIIESVVFFIICKSRSGFGSYFLKSAVEKLNRLLCILFCIKCIYCLIILQPKMTF